MRKKEWYVSFQSHQSRIDDFAYAHHISKKALKDIKMKGDILVNGHHQSVRYLLQEGERVTFIYPQENNHMIPWHFPLSIVYEDDDLLVVNKPAGLPCIPTRLHPHHTLAHALSYYYQQIGLSSTIHLVNRLDKDTKGLMIVAKYRDIHDIMCKELSHIYRVYRAHVNGYVDDFGTIDLPIYQVPQQMKRIIDHKGQQAITHYRRLSYQDGISYVECRLETGRTHQIRVHMAAIEHSLIGDTLYGSEGVFDLESVKVCFLHPTTKRWIYIEKKTSHNH